MVLSIFAALFLAGFAALYGDTDPREWQRDKIGMGNWTIFQPDMYHGHDETSGFFEGWYFKLTTADGDTSLAVIPGIYIGENESTTEAFIIVVDPTERRQHYFTFPASDFVASTTGFDVKIGPNHFTSSSVTLDLSREEGGTFSFKGDLSFSALHPWPVTFSSPGAMGLFAWLSKILPAGMQCHHGVVSMHHKITGVITATRGPAGVTNIDFTDGTGYTEKDWGREFPTSYFWAQCSHFHSTTHRADVVSLISTGAVVPLSAWLGYSITGFIVGLQVDDTLYRFATHTGASIEIFEVEEDSVTFVVADFMYRLKVVAERKTEDTILLPGPRNGRMEEFVPEALGSSGLEVTLTEITSTKVLYAGSGSHAGVEVVGDTSAIESPRSANAHQDL